MENLDGVRVEENYLTILFLKHLLVEYYNRHRLVTKNEEKKIKFIFFILPLRKR